MRLIFNLGWNEIGVMKAQQNHKKNIQVLYMGSSQKTRSNKTTNERRRNTLKKIRSHRIKIPKNFIYSKNKQVVAKKSSSNSNGCPICMEKMEQNNIAILPCEHKFHFSCIFRAASIKRSCPLCRANILPSDAPIQPHTVDVTTFPSVTIMANGIRRTIYHDQYGHNGHAGALYERDGTLLEFEYELLPQIPDVFTIVHDETNQ